MLKIERTPDGKLRYTGSAELAVHEQEFLHTVLNIFMSAPATTQPMSLTFIPDPPQRVVLPPRPTMVAQPPLPPAPTVAPPPPKTVPKTLDLANLRGTQTLPCAQCGTPKQQSSWQIKRNNGVVYCSRACFQQARVPRKPKAIH